MTWNQLISACSCQGRPRSLPAAQCVLTFSLALWLPLTLAGLALASDDDASVDDVEIRIAPGPQMRLIQLQVRANLRAEAAAKRAVLANRDLDILQLFGHDQRERWRLNTESDLAIAYLDRICQLTEPQREKLTLAGRADRQRFFERLKMVATDWRGAGNQSDESKDVLADVQSRLSSGLLDGDSFFAKSLGHILTADQLTNLDTHRRATHQAVANKVLDSLRLKERLDQPQRHALRRLMTTTTPVPVDFGNTDELLKTHTEKSSLDDLFPSQHLKLMKYQLAQKSMQHVKSLLRPNQWQELQPQLIEFGRFEPELRAVKLAHALNAVLPPLEEVPK